ncbi:PhzF family phenazine biosynthesis protein [Geothrix sp.]|jgi:PhzF family phenazine biosynthesis protein|uniref:PhzF family phenazine biosynthesis protein n=1 Tax=Geothrix sp. TaxID=1962974 RepID=UPI0025C5A4DD|nr:PhzF family phenazine biosynthesis protein [Geothrix sp.]
MRLPIYQIDAFADRAFAGNPAAVVLLDQWLQDPVMQAIAAENNLAETAFLVCEPAGWRIRWFTPACEVDLCGHATLASAFVLFERDPLLSQIAFQSRSGLLSVVREGERLVLDFPSRPPAAMTPVAGLSEALGACVREVWKARDLVAVLDDEATVRGLKPDLAALAEMDDFAVVVTAPGDEADFVSRFFGPRVGVPEDPVTGSAHSTLVPFWASRLGRTKLRALQVSPRGGELHCELRGDRVAIGGRAVKVLEGTFFL